MNWKGINVYIYRDIIYMWYLSVILKSLYKINTLVIWNCYDTF